MELISVIVPVYNVEKYLLRCVESIQNQTYKNLEIILVDDESPDKCPEICDKLAVQDARIKVIHKKNGGLGLARNSGLEEVTGEYVTFIDSDDWISKEHIEKLHTELTKQKADAVIGSHTSVDADGKETLHRISLAEGLFEENEILNDIVLPLIGADIDYPNDVQVNASCCMNLYKTDIIRKHDLKFISEKYAVAEDLYFNIDFFLSSTRISAVNEVGYYYYENENSISRKYDPKRFERTINYYNTLYKQVSAHGLQDKIAYRIDRSYLMKIRVAIRHIILSDLKRKEKKHEIKNILHHEITKKVLNNYPINSFIPSMRILVKMMRNENVFGVYYLMKLREGAKKQKLLKSILRSIGIGK